MAKGTLTDRQRKFVELYIELGNATKAAEQAGFMPSYAAGLKRQPAVQAYLAERRNQMPASPGEVVNFLVGVMRGNITTSKLRSDAAYQIGKRAGLWKSPEEMENKIKEAASHE